MKDHEGWMSLALSLGEQAATMGEVPVGCVIVKNETVIGTGFNLKEKYQCSLNHAEIVAIENASQNLNMWRLSGCDVYVTLEPCIMCTGALLQSRIENLYFGCMDIKGGAVKSLYQLANDQRLNHQFEVHSGIKEKECSTMLSDFFKKLRS